MPLPLTPEAPQTERKTLAEMIGEFLREAAVLVAVFAILDRLVQGQAVTTTWLAGAWAIAAAALGAGMLIERLRS
jgi:hypothetical protein